MHLLTTKKEPHLVSLFGFWRHILQWKYCKDPFISRYRFAGFHPTSLKALYLPNKTEEQAQSQQQRLQQFNEWGNLYV